MKYAAEMGSGTMILHTKFHNNWFRHSKVDKGNSQAYRQHRDIISLLLFFQNKESGSNVRQMARRRLSVPP
jgi:hypothetical protein